MKFCQRCNQPRKDADVDAIDTPRPTGAGTTVYVCKVRCKPVPTQTSPVSGSPARRGDDAAALNAP